MKKEQKEKLDDLLTKMSGQVNNIVEANKSLLIEERSFRLGIIYTNLRNVYEELSDISDELDLE